MQDFETSGWQEAFKEKKCSAHISSNLWTLAQKAEERGEVIRGKLLRLLGNVCSMALQPMSPNVPFCPSMVLRDRRSAGADDFSEAYIDFFQQILSSITEPWLTARLADLIWLRHRKVNIGLMAIDAYIEMPITEETFFNEGDLYWMRALRLTRMLGKTAGNREKKIESKLFSACNAAGVEDGFLGRKLANILRSFDLGVDRREMVADKMCTLAAQFLERKDYYQARDYYEAAHIWLCDAGKKEASFQIIASLAETWCIEASVYESDDNFIGAAQCVEKAIQSYRRIPQKHRKSLGVEQKPRKLQAQLNKIGPRISENLICLSVPLPVENIKEMAQKAQECVRGKGLIQAFTGLRELYGGIKLDASRARAKKELKTFRFSMFGSTTVMSPEGRVVEKRPAVALTMNDADSHEIAVHDEMLRHYLLEIGLVANGYIMPALETIVTEHRLTEEFFATLCQQAVIVPPKRIKAWGRMLFAGYEFDFDDVIHRLVPQMEEMVRYHLKAASIVTTAIDPQGIEDEVNLGALLEKPEAVSVFGQERVFEMAALFHWKLGPKFRHELAHGLLEDEHFASPLAVYAWWFALKLVLSPFSSNR